jgi:hypothetical protein
MKLILNMPICITVNNSNPDIPLMNGTTSILVHYQFDPNDITTYPSNNVFELSKLPLAIWIQIDPKLESIPNRPGLFPWLPISTSISCDISTKSTIRVKITTFPIVPAFALTTEKCQGLTLQGAIIPPLRTIDRWNPQSSALYVALSRPSSIENLRLLQPLTLQDFDYFTPSNEIIQELSRLKQME